MSQVSISILKKDCWYRQSLNLEQTNFLVLKLLILTYLSINLWFLTVLNLVARKKKSDSFLGCFSTAPIHLLLPTPPPPPSPHACQYVFYFFFSIIFLSHIPFEGYVYQTMGVLGTPNKMVSVPIYHFLV